MAAALRQPSAVSHAAARHTRRGGRRLWRFRAQDNYPLVLLLTVVSILVVAVVDLLPLRVPMPILFGGTLLYALRTSGVSRRGQVLALILVIASIAGAVTSAVLTGRTGPASGIDGGIAIVLVILAPVAIARRMIAHPAVNVATVAGALCIYLMVGLFFAFLFGFTAAIGLGPFFAYSQAADGADYLYFSFSTLTTLGYGDLVARTTVGRMLAVTEALLGQMYLVSVVALLVSNFGRDRRAETRQATVRATFRAARARPRVPSAIRRAQLATARKPNLQ